jgi:F0F1-type ATP synthase epsilon subunit
MLSRSFISSAMMRQCAMRSMATAAATPAAATSAVKLTFSLPHESLYDGVSVHSVILPGSAGEYGITANHVPYISQLKPGVVQIKHEENSEVEKYFVSGGFALTHEDSSTVSITRLARTWLIDDMINTNSQYLVQDVVCPEAVKLDDIDSSAVTKQFEAAKATFGSAATGSLEQAEAQIDMEVNRAMGLALGINLS